MLASLFLCLDKVQSSMFREIREEKIERKKSISNKTLGPYSCPIMTLYMCTANHFESIKCTKILPIFRSLILNFLPIFMNFQINTSA